MPKYRTIRVDMFHDVAILNLLVDDLWKRGEIHAVQEEVRAYIRAEKPPKLILEMSPVVHVSSEAVTALLRIRDETMGNGGELRLCGLQATVKEVLKITELTRLFHIYETLPDAYRGFAQLPTDEG